MNAHDRARGVENGAAASAADAARLLVEWFVELGYLERGDAVQIVSDEFGDVFVCLTEQGERAIRRDVLDAVQALMPESESLGHFPFWERGQLAGAGDHPGREPRKEC